MLTYSCACHDMIWLNWHSATLPAALAAVACREYRKYWFFVNLQLSIDRALLGGQQSAGAYPAPLRIKIKPFPWPARQEDLGAASAAAFFNLLLVYAFMAPTRVGHVMCLQLAGVWQPAPVLAWSAMHDMRCTGVQQLHLSCAATCASVSCCSSVPLKLDSIASLVCALPFICVLCCAVLTAGCCWQHCA